MKDIVVGKADVFEVVIGLEIHAQIKSTTKLFSHGAVGFANEPNSNLDLLDIGSPGSLPVLNEACVVQAIKACHVLGAAINNYSRFDRKNYFYPDLPTGYQITQFYQPIGSNGKITLVLDGAQKIVNVERIHMEQDAGKSIHDIDPSSTFVDFNRAGTGLLEIVTKPDITSYKEASECFSKIREILVGAGVCEGDLEKGHMRCDANVSVRITGIETLGTRCEIKNLNSMRNVARAIEYEANRQVQMIENGEVVQQQTRLFNADTGVTRAMRDKEEAVDYMYFPDPDLLPLRLSDEYIAGVLASIGEMPEETRRRFVEKYQLTMYEADVIVKDKEVCNYLEEMIGLGASPKISANWILGELFGRLNKMGLDISHSPLSAARLAEIVMLIQNEVISSAAAKSVLEEMFASTDSAQEIVDRLGLGQIIDESIIENLARGVIEANPVQLESYRAGKSQLFGFFVGQALKKSGGRVSPKILNDIMKRLLG